MCEPATTAKSPVAPAVCAVMRRFLAGGSTELSTTSALDIGPLEDRLSGKLLIVCEGAPSPPARTAAGS